MTAIDKITETLDEVRALRAEVKAVREILEGLMQPLVTIDPAVHAGAAGSPSPWPGRWTKSDVKENG